MSKRIPTVDLFLGASLLSLLLGGTYLGSRMVAGLAGLGDLSQWPTLLAAHARIQTIGFVVLFTFGVSLLVLPRFLGVPTSTPSGGSPLSLACFISMSTGLLLGLVHPDCTLPKALLVLGTLLFLAELRRLRRSVPSGSQGSADPLTRIHALYLASGTIWLLLALLQGDLDLLLWGFGGLYVFGVGLRVHPQVLGAPKPAPRLLYLGLLLAHGGLTAQLLDYGQLSALLWLGATLAYLSALRPLQWSVLQARRTQGWLPCYVATSYGWLALASVATVLLAFAPSQPMLQQGAVRHLFATGFLCTMMIGMGMRIIPSFSGRLEPKCGLAHLCFFLLLLGNLLRIPGQMLDTAAGPFLIGGILQASALLVFASSLLGVLARSGELPSEALTTPWTDLRPPGAT